MSQIFSGELPAELGSLNLVHIYVNENGLSGAIPVSIFNISSMTEMDFSMNHFTGKLPSTLGLSLPNLQKLYLGTNKLSGPVPSVITNASSLTVLVMTSNSFSGRVPDFGNLRLLQRLLLAENNLTGTSFLSSLPKCQFLHDVEFSLNHLNGMLPASIGNLSATLQVFRVFGCGIRGPIPAELGNVTNLRDLYLDSNELTGSIPSTLGNLSQLIRIYLEYNKLEGYIPPQLCQLSRLGDLYVSHNMLHGQIPSCIGEMKTLRRLYFDSNKLEGNVPSNLWQLNDLVALNLSTNSLNGSIPSEIGNLKAITDLDLSWNLFSGNVSSSIDKAESLVVLSLAHNKLQGPIPESIGELRGLESLDLSFNTFSGSIPKSLEGLAFLKYLNLSYNRLQGEIPKGGSFANFTAESFSENYGLCSETRMQDLRVPHCSQKSKSVNSWTRYIKYVIPPFILALIVVIFVVVLIRRRRSMVKEQTDDDHPSLHAWKRSSYLELQRATDGFSESNKLGSGGFGTVYKGTLSSGLIVAVKVFNLESERVAKSFDTEVEVLSSIRHRNLIKIIGCCSSEDFKALLYEYMPNGSLEKWLYSSDCFLDLQGRVGVAVDVASALEYLHVGLTSPIVHCDLKPSNVLLDEDMTARVGDFGIAKLFGEGEMTAQTRTLATVGYMAPGKHNRYFYDFRLKRSYISCFSLQNMEVKASCQQAGMCTALA